jgi:hypothetical protein
MPLEAVDVVRGLLYGFGLEASVGLCGVIVLCNDHKVKKYS